MTTLGLLASFPDNGDQGKPPVLKPTQNAGFLSLLARHLHQVEADRRLDLYVWPGGSLYVQAGHNAIGEACVHKTYPLDLSGPYRRFASTSLPEPEPEHRP
jgi:hypothetical protein